MTCLIYSLLNWLYRGTETEEQIQKRLSNARAELDQSNSPGLFDHLLVNDDLETCYENLKVIHQDHCYLALLLFYNSRLQLGSSSFLNNCYCNLQKLLSLDDDQEDSDALCKFHELCCLQFSLMLWCVFSYSKFGYCQLSRMVKQTASYCIVSKNDSEILLQPDTNEAKNGATSLYVILPLVFF